jgi:hypothetical protein
MICHCFKSFKSFTTTPFLRAFSNFETARSFEINYTNVTESTYKEDAFNLHFQTQHKIEKV